MKLTQSKEKAGVKPAVPRARAASRRRALARAPLPTGATVRPVRRADLDSVISLDASVTGVEKRKYWERIFHRYGMAPAHEQRWFLVAERAARVVGFLIGEVRDWEFGSPPCGWVFALDVDPAAREAGVGTRLLEEAKARCQRAGVGKLRTLLHRDNLLILSFFRSQGMMAGPLIPLQMDLPRPSSR